MINLLPLEEKQKLSLENKKKLTTVLGIVVVVSLICFALILLSIKFYILTMADYQKDMLIQAEKKYPIKDFVSSESAVQKYNVTLAQIDSFYKKEIYFNQALESITNISSPNGLYLTNFSLNRDKNGIIQVSLSGVSDTREDLLTFRTNIEADKDVKNSYFTPESWASPKKVNFSLTFEIDHNAK